MEAAEGGEILDENLLTVDELKPLEGFAFQFLVCRPRRLHSRLRTRRLCRHRRRGSAPTEDPTAATEEEATSLPMDIPRASLMHLSRATAIRLAALRVSSDALILRLTCARALPLDRVDTDERVARSDKCYISFRAAKSSVLAKRNKLLLYINSIINIFSGYSEGTECEKLNGLIIRLIDEIVGSSRVITCFYFQFQFQRYTRSCPGTLA